MKKLILLMILGALAILLASCSDDRTASATAPEIDKRAGGLSVIPPQANPHGRSHAEWSVAFWQWLWSIPADTHPGLDETGEFVAMHQSGKVWFLAANFGGETVRTATIPPGKMLYINVAAWFGSPYIGDPEDEDELWAALAEANELTENITLEVDGMIVENIDDFRVQSPGLFGWTQPEGSVFEIFYGLPAGSYEPAAADGYFVMLAPLSRGEHTIHIHADLPFGFGASDITYYLTVGPQH